MLEQASELSRDYHKNQRYGFESYFEAHILKVVDKLISVLGITNIDAVVVAYLHDIVEDTDMTLYDLLVVHRFSQDIVDAVDAITKQPNETRKQYLVRCKQNNIAHKVKIADTLANLDASVSSCDAWRVEKYSKQLIELYKI